MRGKLEEVSRLERNSSIFQTTHVAGLVTNQIGTITKANPAALNLLGYTLDQITNRTIQYINPTVSLYTWKDLFKSAHEKPQLIITEIINKQQLPLIVMSEHKKYCPTPSDGDSKY